MEIGNREIKTLARGQPQETRAPAQDTYQGERSKGRYLGRHFQRRKNATKEKYDFSNADTSFTERIGAEAAEFEKPGMESAKLIKLRTKAEQAGEKTAKAKNRAPHKSEYRLVRQYDERTGKTTHVLETTNKPKPVKHEGVVKRTKRQMTMEANNFVHKKVAENEKDNSAVEGTHKIESQAERAHSFIKRNQRNRGVRKQSKVHALEARQFKAETAYRYEKYLEENPDIQKKFFQKRIQKQRIKREYAKALRAQKAAGGAKAAAYAQKAAAELQQTTVVTGKLKQIITRNKHALIVMGGMALLMITLMTMMMSCVAMFGGGVSTTMVGTYQSDPDEIEAVALNFTKMEADLAVSIAGIETDNPGYDDYEYDLGDIGHNPFTLINYLSAKYGEFTAADVEAELTAIFNEMYTLTTEEKTETRTRTVHNEETGEDEEEEYEAKILVVTLTVKPMEDIVNEKLAGNTDAQELYQVYNDSHGAMQTLESPLQMDWYSRITSNYGYRADPFDATSLELHRGLDIGVPEGTPVFASQNGTVMTAAYDPDGYGYYVIIEDAEGVSTRYAHLKTLNVTAGQPIAKGMQIAESGNTGSSTGPHLHIECLKNGVYYNPIFYFENGGVI
ncbi:MAG: peptidoglycan DD-metalloendopeptidase family protein [Lachnospiraceae bacterium]|nr:peptidoglycan DD-metalloendopeptidase family protein [Lachnospiraceae bacterium]